MASTLSVLTFASAIARVFCGLEITTRATRPSSSLAIACVLQVASSATSSLGARLSANRRSPLRGRRDLPGLADAAVLPDRDLRELAMHIKPQAPARHHSPPAPLDREGDGRANDTYGFALAPHPGKSQGTASYTSELAADKNSRPARPRSPRAPLSRNAPNLRSGPDAASDSDAHSHAGTPTSRDLTCASGHVRVARPARRPPRSATVRCRPKTPTLRSREGLSGRPVSAAVTCRTHIRPRQADQVANLLRQRMPRESLRVKPLRESAPL